MQMLAVTLREAGDLSCPNMTFVQQQDNRIFESCKPTQWDAAFKKLLGFAVVSLKSALIGPFVGGL